MIHDEQLPFRLESYLSKKKIAIFLFHGVINKQCHLVRNYTRKNILSNYFWNSMKHISKIGNPISMDAFLYYQKKLNNLIGFV